MELYIHLSLVFNEMRLNDIVETLPVSLSIIPLLFLSLSFFIYLSIYLYL